VIEEMLTGQYNLLRKIEERIVEERRISYDSKPNLRQINVRQSIHTLHRITMHRNAVMHSCMDSV
jgi:hypothetical protein